MNDKWSLNELYTSFQDRSFSDDMLLSQALIAKFGFWVEDNTRDYSNMEKKLEEYIDLQTKIFNVTRKLQIYCELTISVDTKNEEALKNSEVISDKLAAIAEPSAKFNKWIGAAENIKEIITSSKILSDHSFYIMELIKNSKHILSSKEEIIIAKMKNTGSTAWSKLKDRVTSELLVDIEVQGKEEALPLSEVRNMAYDASPSVRKSAYAAELKAYPKVQDTVAACLNGIKGEVITVSDLRGYSSPLQETLENSRMDYDTLSSMLLAMKESLPYFRKYFKRKAKILGHKNGLPFYDLFAPIGNATSTFTYEEAKDFIVSNFSTFSDSLSDFALKAFEKSWIDPYPKAGKVGGAFCENIHVIGESRIMTNFSGRFNDVITIAHELGHGYHGECLLSQTPLNSDYPMPIAETASTFCETIVKKAAMKNLSKEDSLSIVETEISDCAQVIVDILSRYIFETEVFKRRSDGSISAKELMDIMVDAQKEAFGDGLDPEFLHPYMWICKPHYYSADFNFYNFPYAFGLLFAKGLYSKYLENSSTFPKEYDKLLKLTGTNNLAQVTGSIGIDIHSIDFWRSSLNIIKEDINTFLDLTNLND